MASLQRRLSTNVAGAVYVDDSCIDCGTCRWMAPAVFDRAGGRSRVHTQPGEDQELRALQALVACPTASIGTTASGGVRAAAASFPVPIEPGATVLHCGFHSEHSFGASSWLVLRPEGHVLVDSPRFARPLVRRLEELGGVSLMVLSHCDDVADHARFAAHFGCERVLHEDDLDHRTRDVERVLTGTEPDWLAPDLEVLPTPGHTRGSVCLQHRDVLFTGDSMAWHPAAQRLHAFRGACWFDWPTLERSLASLRGRRVRWVLPGHGAPGQLDPARFDAELDGLLAWMRAVA